MRKCTRNAVTAQAVERAMGQHDGLVHAFIQRQGGGDISYEEALQAGRIGLWRAIEGYDPTRGTAFSTYAWVAIYRHVHRRANELNRDTHVEVREMSAAWVLPDPVEALERKMIIHALHDLVNQLPQQMRRIVIGRYGLGMQPLRTLNELGEQLGLSGERVRQLQQEALAWLRHPAHSWRLRQLVGKNTAADYRQALAQNAALRRARRKTR
jgi:RNA polymerase sigma factor (sigma-70 family)